MAPADSNTSRVHSRGDRGLPLAIADPDGTAALDDNLLYEHAGLDPQVRPLARWRQKRIRGAGASAIPLRDMCQSDAVLFSAVDVDATRQAERRASVHEGMRNWIRRALV